MKEHYETLRLSTHGPYVINVELNRPEKKNAINDKMWDEIKTCFDSLSTNPDCRVIILTGAGDLFSSGLDISSMMNMPSNLSQVDDIARKCRMLEPIIQRYQNSITSLEKCSKPIICAIHGGCIGGGVDIITAADIRLCSKDAWFQVKEVDIGMAADVGTLQRLPKVIGSDSLARELCYTARKLHADEAFRCGLVSRVFDSKASLMKEAIQLACVIASKSPVAVQGTKRSVVYSRDHTVQEGLDHLVLWNQAMLQSEDLVLATMNQMSKSNEPALFAKL